MTNKRTEIKKKIDNLNNKIFYLTMKDRWTSEDFEKNIRFNTEVTRLEKELKEIEKIAWQTEK